GRRRPRLPRQQPHDGRPAAGDRSGEVAGRAPPTAPASPGPAGRGRKGAVIRSIPGRYSMDLREGWRRLSWAPLLALALLLPLAPARAAAPPKQSADTVNAEADRLARDAVLDEVCRSLVAKIQDRGLDVPEVLEPYGFSPTNKDLALSAHL